MSGDFLAAFLLGGLTIMLGVEAFRQYRLGRSAATWPTAEGRIVSAELEEGPMMGRFRRVVSHRAAITYTYDARGRQWTSHQVFFGDRAFATGDAARDRVRHYEPDRTVQVFYDPDDPANAVLEPRAAWQQSARRALTWAGLTVLAIVAVFVAGRITSRRS